MECACKMLISMFSQSDVINILGRFMNKCSISFFFRGTMGTLLKDRYICRFCAKEDKDYHNLYSENISCQKCDDQCSMSYTQVSNQYLKVKLEETSFYPRFSCFDCSCFLLKLVTFYKTLENGQSKLDEILISEGHLEIKKRGRPKKGLEKIVPIKQIEHQHKFGKRKIKPPSRFQDALSVSVKSESVDDEKGKESGRDMTGSVMETGFWKWEG